MPSPALLNPALLGTPVSGTAGTAGTLPALRLGDTPARAFAGELREAVDRGQAEPPRRPLPVRQDEAAPASAAARQEARAREASRQDHAREQARQQDAAQARAKAAARPARGEASPAPATRAADTGRGPREVEDRGSDGEVDRPSPARETAIQDADNPGARAAARDTAEGPAAAARGACAGLQALDGHGEAEAPAADARPEALRGRGGKDTRALSGLRPAAAGLVDGEGGSSAGAGVARAAAQATRQDLGGVARAAMESTASTTSSSGAASGPAAGAAAFAGGTAGTAAGMAPAFHALAPSPQGFSAPPSLPDVAPASVFEARLSAPPGSPEFGPALGVQLTILAREGIQEARLQLHPAELGPIAVQIALEGTQAQVNFQADVPATRDALQASLPDLAAALRDGGFTLAGGGVSDGASSGARDDGAASRAPTGAPHAAPAARSDAERGSSAAPVTRRQGVVDLYA